MANAAGSITLTNAGIYQADYYVLFPTLSAGLLNRFQLFLGGAAIAGSDSVLVVGVLAIGASNMISGQAIFSATAGQVLQLRNLNLLTIALPTGGGTIASLSVIRIV